MNKKCKNKFGSIIAVMLSMILILSSVFVFNINSVEASGRKEKKESLKILAIGNSFAYNTLHYVSEMATELGYEDVVVGNLYIGGCSLDKHWKNARENKAVYEYGKKNGSLNNKKWRKTYNVSIEQVLSDEEWDYIVMGQYSGDSGKLKTYKNLGRLVKFVKKRVNKNTKFIWNMTWAYQGNYNKKRFAYYKYDQKFMYKKIVKVTKKKIKKNKNFHMVIPSATVIQNARMSSYGDHLTVDGRHLNKKARYMASLGFTCALLDVKPEKVSYQPKGITKKARKIAIEAVNEAIKNPYNITEIK